MSGWFVFPISPEKTIFFVFPSSVSHTSIAADPRRWPTSVKRIRIPSQTSISMLYGHGTKYFMMRVASSDV